MPPATQPFSRQPLSPLAIMFWAVAIDEDRQQREREKKRRKRQAQQNLSPRKPASPSGPRPF
jgi:hypothetical protein